MNDDLELSQRDGKTAFEWRMLMSTKCSLTHGPGFHLYREAFDDDNVYLEVEGTHFEAAYNRVMLPIPVHVWEVIRRCQGTYYEYVDKSDAELRDMVERGVDERLNLHEDASERVAPRHRFSGMLIFGSIDAPREEQIAKGITHFTQIREHQRQIRRAVDELEQLQRCSE